MTANDRPCIDRPLLFNMVRRGEARVFGGRPGTKDFPPGDCDDPGCLYREDVIDFMLSFPPGYR